MGDRRNVIVKNNNAGVGLYTHWSGSELKETVKTALKRHQRWDDDAYLARIIFCQMVKGQESDETGFGITPGDSLCEASAWDITVDVAAQTVKPGTGKKALSFSEFIK